MYCYIKCFHIEILNELNPDHNLHRLLRYFLLFRSEGLHNLWPWMFWTLPFLSCFLLWSPQLFHSSSPRSKNSPFLFKQNSEIRIYADQNYDDCLQISVWESFDTFLKYKSSWIIISTRMSTYNMTHYIKTFSVVRCNNHHYMSRGYSMILRFDVLPLGRGQGLCHIIYVISIV